MKSQDGDEALERWWVRAYPRLLAYLIRSGASRDQAEDILQDVAVLALRAEETRDFHDRQSFEQWLYRHARWRLLDDVRSRKRRPVAGQLTNPDSVMPLQAPGQEAGVRLTEILEALFRRLPSRQSEVMRLAILGFSSRDVAERLGITPATVRSHLRFARNHLAELLKEQGENS